jgi:hypothetical protein
MGALKGVLKAAKQPVVPISHRAFQSEHEDRNGLGSSCPWRPGVRVDGRNLCGIYGLAIGIVEFVRESSPKEATARAKEPVNELAAELRRPPWVRRRVGVPVLSSGGAGSSAPPFAFPARPSMIVAGAAGFVLSNFSKVS